MHTGRRAASVVGIWHLIGPQELSVNLICFLSFEFELCNGIYGTRITLTISLTRSASGGRRCSTEHPYPHIPLF